MLNVTVSFFHLVANLKVHLYFSLYLCSSVFNQSVKFDCVNTSYLKIILSFLWEFYKIHNVFRSYLHSLLLTSARYLSLNICLEIAYPLLFRFTTHSYMYTHRYRAVWWNLGNLGEGHTGKDVLILRSQQLPNCI